jgi:hypothetical protein
MRFPRRTAALLLLALPLLHCSHKPEFEPARNDILGELQKKRKKLNEKGVIAEVALAESRDLQTGMNKVELEARARLARSLESRISSLQKRFQEEVGRESGDHFSQTVKGLSDQLVRGTALAETPFERDREGNYRVYGLMILDGDLYGKALSAQLEADNALRDRWRASRAYKELNEEMAAFQEWKRQEAAPATGAQGRDRGDREPAAREF